MSFPLAAHTLSPNFIRVWLSQRDLAVPGSGTWSSPVKIFDGSGSMTIPGCRTFSAGGLDSSSPYGIVGNSGNVHNELAFLGNGLPTSPILISYPGQTGFIVSSDYWDTSQGAIYYDGSAGGTAGYYLPHYCQGEFILRIIKTTDDGASWAQCDSANAPIDGDGTTIAMQRVDHFLYFFISLDFSDTNWSILPFDMSTATYGAPFAAITISNFARFAQSSGDSWTNGLFKFSNGDFAVIYQETVTDNVNYISWDGASWSSPLVLPSGSVGYANSLIDPALASVHVLTYSGSDISSPINYHNITHPGMVLTTVANAIPAPVTTTNDGVGHSSIQGGMLFVPRDDLNDNDNSVWVATLPIATFSKELLPIPAGEEDETPSCAYMMFPNGYSLSLIPDVILTFNLHGATTPPNALLTVNPPTSGPPGPIINPTQCIEQDGVGAGGGIGPPLPPLPPPIPPGVTSPVITTLTVPGGTVGFFYPAFAFSASGAGPITWHATGLPPSLGLSINGFLFGNVVGPAGTFSFQVTATNSSGTSSPVTFSITIGAFGVAPSITNVSPLPNANVGTPYAITFTANGTAPITWSSLIPINTFFDPVTAIFSFTPTAVGVINFQVRATNGAGDTGLLPFSITVDPPAIPIPPIIPTPPGG